MKRLLQDDRYDVVAVSGTSGGGICAVLAWYALIQHDGEGAAARAARPLDSFWKDNSASELYDWLLNEWFLWMNRLQGAVVLPEVSPYSTPTSYWAHES